MAFLTSLIQYRDFILHLFTIKFRNKALRLDLLQNKLSLIELIHLPGSSSFIVNILTDVSLCYGLMRVRAVTHNSKSNHITPHHTTSNQKIGMLADEREILVLKRLDFTIQIL